MALTKINQSMVEGLLTKIADLEAQIAGVGLGVGQTWQDVSGSRTHSTTYQNTSGRPIQLAITCQGSSRPVQVSPDGVTWIQVGEAGSDRRITNNAVVPSNWYYRINGSTNLYTWSELR